MHNTRQGFTLIELMVAIALMLLLIGIVMSIFHNSSTAVTMAEAKVEIFQNARTTFEAMAQEITDATEICIYNEHPEHMEHPNLTIKTIAHWIEDNKQKSEEAVVCYYIIPKPDLVNEEILYSLQKKIFPRKTNTEKKYYTIKKEDINKYTAILSEYLVCPVNSHDNSIPQPTQNLPIYIERLKANSDNTSWNWNGDNYQTRLNLGSPDSSEEGFSNETSDTTEFANNSLPVAIRITMTFTDEFLRAKRTVSRVFWIPKGK